MTLTVIIGDVGEGKTTYGLWTLKVVNEKNPVKIILILEDNIIINGINNIKIIPPEDLLDLDKIKNPSGYCLFIDEVYGYLDSALSSSSDIKTFWKFVLFQSRHRGMDFVFTLPTYRRLDINYRELWNYLIECTNDRANKKFVYNVTHRKGERLTHMVKILSYEKALKYQHMFDTYQIIQPQELEKIKYGFIRNNPEKLTAYLNKAAMQIRPKLNKINKDSVRTALAENGFNVKITDMVLCRLRGEVVGGQS
jgi:hypothetical protein